MLGAVVSLVLFDIDIAVKLSCLNSEPDISRFNLKWCYLKAVRSICLELVPLISSVLATNLGKYKPNQVRVYTLHIHVVEVPQNVAKSYIPGPAGKMAEMWLKLGPHPASNAYSP